MKRNGLGQIKDAVSISERPASVEDRAVPGHWEGDLIGGSRNSYVATLVERHSRYVMLVKVANKDTESVVSALIKQSQKLPGELYQSLTWDRGKELADHQRLALATERRGLLLRSPITLATRLERKHQPTAAPVPASRAPTCPCKARPSSAPSPDSSTNGQEKPCSIKPQRRRSPSVLQRSVEPTGDLAVPFR